MSTTLNYDFWTALSGLPLKPLPEWQVRLTQTLPRATGTLSVVGSLLVIYMILASSRHRIGHARNRFVLAISLIDVPFSLMFALGPVLMPSGALGESAGTVATCNMQGWFLQAGYSQPIYNAFFMVYFAMQIMLGLGATSSVGKRGGAGAGLSGCRDRAVALLGRGLEPAAHVLSVGFAVGTATAGLYLNGGLYNPTPIIGRCIINEHPFFCSKNPKVACERGWDYEKYMHGFQIVPTIAALAVQLAALLAISVYVVGHSIRMNRRARARLRGSGVGVTSRSSATSTATASSRGGGGDSYSREVVVTAIIYGLVFFNSYFWSAVIFLRGYAGSPFWLRMLSAAFQPLQGFFTFLIVLRPRYVQLRKCHQDWWWWKIVWVSIVKGSYDLPSSGSRSSNSKTAVSTSSTIRTVARRSSRRFSEEDGGDDANCDNIVEDIDAFATESRVPRESTCKEVCVDFSTADDENPSSDC